MGCCPSSRRCSVFVEIPASAGNVCVLVKIAFAVTPACEDVEEAASAAELLDEKTRTINPGRQNWATEWSIEKISPKTPLMHCKYVWVWKLVTLGGVS